jgi:hypothetical protein
MSNTAVVTLAKFAPGKTFTYSINTQAANSYHVQVVDQGGSVLVDKTVQGVNWTFTTGIAMVPTDTTRWPLNLLITGSASATLSVLESSQGLVSYNTAYITSYVVTVDDAGTGADRDFNDIVITLNGYNSVG